LKNEECLTIATQDQSSQQPGLGWLESSEVTVISNNEDVIKYTPVNLESEVEFKDNINATVLEIHQEFNGTLSSFGEKFWKYICEKNTELNEAIKNERISEINYSDRYLQSPESVLLLSEILASANFNGVDSIIIETLFRDIDRKSFVISHNWPSLGDFEKIFETWITHRTKLIPSIIIEHELRDTPHRRLLSLKFESGKKADIYLDQGFGYWRLNCKKGTHRYSFEANLERQKIDMSHSFKNAEVINGGDWKTPITVHFI
jgi:hypothetical protein